MKEKNQNNLLQAMHTLSPQPTEERYAAPEIEIIYIENSQNILAGSLDDMPGRDW
ncbi:hypothetical protein [Bacteroides heparinolyticus]|uniref:hypothetical protein n=1 Tax=Prevotella heparinolytica TaxID=28113 RepID=UPI00359F50D6